jgi:hypothetical protein
MTIEAVAGARDARLEGARARGGLTAADYLTLFLIGLVVVLVSLPRLRRFALRENELDAIALLAALGDDMGEFGAGLRAGGIAGLLAANERHEHRFEDLELLPGGLLRRHGYLFDAQETLPGQWVLRGWPWSYGRTGLGTFAFSSAQGLIGNANSDGRCDGPARPPEGAEAAAGQGGWRALRR